MRLVEATVPAPGPGDVLIRVAAAGLNFADLSRANGTFLNGPQPPFLGGFEAAGEVMAVGEGVEDVRVGAQVVGVGSGAFAEYMVMRAATVMPIPTGWTATQALGLVVWLSTMGQLPSPAHRAASTRRRARCAPITSWIGDWQAGRVRCIELLQQPVHRAGDWRMLATVANGQPAAAVYRRNADGALRPSGIVVLAATASGISRVTAFHHAPELVGLFGFDDWRPDSRAASTR